MFSIPSANFMDEAAKTLVMEMLSQRDRDLGSRVLITGYGAAFVGYQLGLRSPASVSRAQSGCSWMVIALLGMDAAFCPDRMRPKGLCSTT
jgi:hypothetical protein